MSRIIEFIEYLYTVLLGILMWVITDNTMQFVLTVIISVSIPIISHIFKRRSLKERITRFQTMHENLLKESDTYERIAYNWYKNNYNESLIGSYLLYKSNWIHKAGSKLLKLSDVKINYSARQNEDKNFNILRNSLRKSILPATKDTFLDNAARYLKKRYWNHPTFAMKDFSMDVNGATLDVYLGDYYDFLNTCMLFQFDTVYDFIEKNKRSPSKNSLRRKYSLLDMENRFVSIGLSTLTILKNVNTATTPIVLNSEKANQTPLFLIHNRSSKVTTSANQMHVVPSGGYQPSTVSRTDHIETIKKALSDKENLMSTIEREFAEEILGHKDVEDLYNYEVLRKYNLKSMLKNTYLLGAGFYPLDTHVDIFSITIIDVARSNLGNTVDAIMSNVKGNFEGQVSIKPFNKAELIQCQKQHDATPSLKSIFEIIINDYGNITKQLGV